MSDSSLPLTAAPPAPPSTGHAGAELLHSLAPLLADWLPRQRWFAGKGHPISGFTPVTATELLPLAVDGTAPGLLHMLVRARQTATAAELAPGAEADCYQLLLGVRSVLPPGLATALIGRPATGALRGLAVYDALHDPRLTGLLLERLRSPGRLGALRFAGGMGGTSTGTSMTGTSMTSSGTTSSGTTSSGTTSTRGDTRPDIRTLRPRPLDAEQSNSSVVYGDAYILKLFRRVGPGLNPDLELPLALARAGCDRVPEPTAWFETAPAPRRATLTLGVLQPFLAGSGDGWQLALHALAGRQDFTGQARALGRATAEVHAGLADALPTTVLHGSQLAQLAREMDGRLNTAAHAVPALRPYRGGLRSAFAALGELSRRGHTRRAQRVHGDLHLGQALCAADGGRWSLIDFEGEPARPLDERRRTQPAVRDVAGMLRSFDYAACQQGISERWTHLWAEANRAAYCGGYAEVTGADPRDDATLLRAFETDKAVYEVLYEARHRPGWLPIPLSAIRRLAAPET
ncbi:phosphotransferase [Streptomyces sp. N2-109]|uniref:Maltokinase n=1 Tax=Streptomyces gossypii TaxID=2883101 RepID=A0ABT2JZ20_9ACTN|nr:phosphotransferase [Streptomyces gossypii]MCT2592494.1 phosphotransferase [Streptomyces gossypii]